MKFKVLYEKFFKKNAPLILAGTITVSVLKVADIIDESEEKHTIDEYVTAQNEFNLLGDSDLQIITVKGKDNKKSIHFVKCMRDSDIHNIKETQNEYDIYYDSKLAKPCDTFMYFDINDGSIVSVKYVTKEKHLFESDKIIETSYKVNEIIESDYAYNYAIDYIGDKEIYTKDEINKMVRNLQERKLKIYTK